MFLPGYIYSYVYIYLVYFRPCLSSECHILSKSLFSTGYWSDQLHWSYHLYLHVQNQKKFCHQILRMNKTTIVLMNQNVCKSSHHNLSYFSFSWPFAIHSTGFILQIGTSHDVGKKELKPSNSLQVPDLREDNKLIEKF